MDIDTFVVGHHHDLGQVTLAGDGPSWHKQPHLVIQTDTGLLVRVPEADVTDRRVCAQADADGTPVRTFADTVAEAVQTLEDRLADHGDMQPTLTLPQVDR